MSDIFIKKCLDCVHCSDKSFFSDGSYRCLSWGYRLVALIGCPRFLPGRKCKGYLKLDSGNCAYSTEKNISCDECDIYENEDVW